MRDFWNFSFFGHGVFSPTHSTHSQTCRFVSESYAKTPGLVQFVNKFVNKLSNLTTCTAQIQSWPGLVFRNNFFFFIGHRNNVFARCDSIFPLLRCQGVWNKTCTQLSLSPNPVSESEELQSWDVQRFCYHSWCNSTVIFGQISNSSNVYLSSSRFWTTTSLVIFYQLPSVSKSRIPPKNVWSVQSLIHISRLHQC